LEKDKKKIQEILSVGKQKASRLAKETISQVRGLLKI